MQYNFITRHSQWDISSPLYLYAQSEIRSLGVCPTISVAHRDSQAMEGVPVATVSSYKTCTQQQAPAQTRNRRNRRAQYIAAIVGESACSFPLSDLFLGVDLIENQTKLRNLLRTSAIMYGSHASYLNLHSQLHVWTFSSYFECFSFPLNLI